MIWTGKLDRYVMGVGGRQMLFSLSVLTLVLVAGLVAPLVGSGANWLDVMLYLPQQIALPMTITLPVAVMSATALCLAGMYDSRELVALASVGIHHRRVVLALLPMALLTALLTGWLAHVALPKAMASFREARTELVSQALAVRVARQQPIVDKADGGFLAMDCDQSQVFDVIGHQQDGDSLTVAYAPDGHLFSNTSSVSQRFDFNLHDLRVLRIDGSPEDPRLSVIRLPQASSGLVLPKRPDLLKPDVLPTDQLALAIPWLQATFRLLDSDDDQQAFWPLVLDGFTPLAADPRSAISDDRLHEEQGRAFSDLAAESPERRAQVEAIVRSGLSGSDPRSSMMLEWSRWLASDATIDQARGSLPRGMGKMLRKMELNWHMRWILACSPLTLWLLGCGVGLRLNLNNHTLVPMLAIGCMLLAIGPAVVMVDGLRHRLPISPAWFLWPMQAIYLSLGAWWLRRLQ